MKVMVELNRIRITISSIKKAAPASTKSGKATKNK